MIHKVTLARAIALDIQTYLFESDWFTSGVQPPTSSFRIQNVHSRRRAWLETVERFQEGLFHRRPHRIHWCLVCQHAVVDLVSVNAYTSRDTVNSVGLIPRRLPFTTSNTIVRTFRHAVALDERRSKFKANLWNRPSVKEAKLGVEGQKPEVAETADSPVDAAPKAPKADKKPKVKKQATLRAMERKFSEGPVRPTDIEEVRIFGIIRKHFELTDL
jgi:hypothetical protein